MKTLRDFICYNQKQIMIYEYTLSELHRELRKLMEDKDNIDKQKIDDAYQTLFVDSFLMMEDIFTENNNFIMSTLGEDDENLRFTIKMVNDDSVIDIYRNHEIKGFYNSTLYSDNTAFKSIMNKGLAYYLNNDLSDSYIKGEYENPRLSKSEKWEEAWKDYANDSIISESYYNSTLVIPMAITSKDVDSNGLFFKKYFNDLNPAKANTTTRAILGFVCFDTKKKDYFDELDIDLAHIITDILSLYLFFYYNFVISSKIVQQYEDSIN